MAQTINVRSSNITPVKTSYVEVEVKDDATSATAGAITNDIPLGQAYRSVKLVSIASSVTANDTAYADCSASAIIKDTATVKIRYKGPANIKVIATFECEV